MKQIASGRVDMSHSSGTAQRLGRCAAGEFFMPCWQADLVCQRQLEAGLAAGSWDTANLVGRHWFAGTWNTPAKLRPAMIKAKVTAA